MQIYDTKANSWSVILLPGNTYGGSMVAVLANGIIYFCGGITNGTTISNCNTYNLTSNNFGAMSPLVVPVNHAAYAWDNNDKIYVIGGRYAQVYEPMLCVFHSACLHAFVPKYPYRCM